MMLLKRLSKVNAIDTCWFFWKTQYNTVKSGLEKNFIDAKKKIHDTGELAKKKEQIIIQRSMRLKVSIISIPSITSNNT